MMAKKVLERYSFVFLEGFFALSELFWLIASFVFLANFDPFNATIHESYHTQTRALSGVFLFFSLALMLFVFLRLRHGKSAEKPAIFGNFLVLFFYPLHLFFFPNPNFNFILILVLLFLSVVALVPLFLYPQKPRLSFFFSFLPALPMSFLLLDEARRSGAFPFFTPFIFFLAAGVFLEATLFSLLLAQTYYRKDALYFHDLDAHVQAEIEGKA